MNRFNLWNQALLNGIQDIPLKPPFPTQNIPLLAHFILTSPSTYFFIILPSPLLHANILPLSSSRPLFSICPSCRPLFSTCSSSRSLIPTFPSSAHYTRISSVPHAARGSPPLRRGFNRHGCVHLSMPLGGCCQRARRASMHALKVRRISLHLPGHVACTAEFKRLEGNDEYGRDGWPVECGWWVGLRSQGRPQDFQFYSRFYNLSLKPRPNFKFIIFRRSGDRVCQEREQEILTERRDSLTVCHKFFTNEMNDASEFSG